MFRYMKHLQIARNSGFIHCSSYVRNLVILDLIGYATEVYKHEKFSPLSREVRIGLLKDTTVSILGQNEVSREINKLIEQL